MAEVDYNLTRILTGGLTVYGLVDDEGKSQAIEGVIKAAQKFAMVFLTEQGSMPDDPERGTTFLTDLRFGVVRTEFDVVSSFTNAVAQALDYFAEIQADAELPDDERIVDARLNTFELDAPRIIVNIVVTTAAGDSAEVVAPIDVLNIEIPEV